MGIIGKAGFIDYDVRLKDFFFDRQRVVNAVDKMTHRVLFWFGGRVREKTRSYLGKPKPSAYGARGSGHYRLNNPPRPAPKPPTPRVQDSATVTLRNIQYNYVKTADGGKSRVFVPKYRGTQRFGGKTAPELQEFGGTVRARAKTLWQLPPNDKRRKKNQKRTATLIFNNRFPMRSFRLPARPYLGANMSLANGKTGFEKAIIDAKKRIEKGQSPFNIGRLGRGRAI